MDSKKPITINSLSPHLWQSFKRLLAIDHRSIELQVVDGPSLYKDLDPRALYTSFEDLKNIFESEHCSGTWVDLGAGIGTSALLYCLAFPDREALAIEKASARITKGEELRKKLGLSRVKLIEGDLLNIEIPCGDTYFLYFPTGHVLDRILKELYKKNFRSLIVIESHGDLLPRLNKEKWLKEKGSIQLKSQRHHPCAVIFEKQNAPIDSGPHQLSFEKHALLIKEKSGLEWIGESYGLEWLGQDQYQLAHPPRSINWHQVIKNCALQELPEIFQFLIALRRLGSVDIYSQARILRGELRKIATHPSFKLELSHGEWVEWKDVKRLSFGDILCYESSSDYFYLPPVPLEP